MGTTGRTLLSVVAVAALLPACAEGGGVNDTGRTGGGDGSIGGRRDGGFMLRRDGSVPGRDGGGMPTIQLTMNEGDAFRFDVMSACGTPVSCMAGGTGGSATAIDQFSFTDDQSMPGESQWSTRDQAWPTSLKIRVFRTTPGASCAQYVLHVSR